MRKVSLISFLAFFSALVTFGWLQFFLKNANLNWFYLSMGFLAFNNLAIAFFMVKNRSWLNFFLFPTILSLTATAFIIIIKEPWLIQTIIALLTFIIYMYWRFVFYYLHAPKNYTAFSLENISFYGNFFAVYFLGAAGLGLKLFLGLDQFLVMAILAPVLALIIYQSFWVAKYSFKNSWTVYLASWLVLMQAFYGLMLLPNDYLLLAFIWSTIYYLVTTTVNDYFSKQLNSFKIKAYLGITLVCWLVLFLTAVWL